MSDNPNNKESRDALREFLAQEADIKMMQAQEKWARAGISPHSSTAINEAYHIDSEYREKMRRLDIKDEEDARDPNELARYFGIKREE